MLAHQLGISPGHALLLLRAHAFSHSMSLLTAARDVLARRLRLDDDPGTGPS
jgi:hypothetical protein